MDPLTNGEVGSLDAPSPGGGGTPDFEWQGGEKDFFGFEIHGLVIFLGEKILASIFSRNLFE